jgi:hypothetical protein
MKTSRDEHDGYHREHKRSPVHIVAARSERAAKTRIPYSDWHDRSSAERDRLQRGSPAECVMAPDRLTAPFVSELTVK